jgi:hypothetical protein
MRITALPALATLVACALCVDTAAAFAPASRLALRRTAPTMPWPSGSCRMPGAGHRLCERRGRSAQAPFLSTLRAEAEEPLVLPPKQMAGAYVDSMDQYEKMYRESLDDPEVCVCVCV